MSRVTCNCNSASCNFPDQVLQDPSLEQFFSKSLFRPSARHGLKFIPGRHVRSNCRCSCVLQFTRLHAVSCVLHRPTSRVIHHSRFLFRLFVSVYCLFSKFSFALLLVYKIFVQTVLPRPAKGKEGSLRAFASLQPCFKSAASFKELHHDKHGEPWLFLFR